MAEKIRAFEEWLQRSDWVAYDRYLAQRVVAKLAVQVAKIMAHRRWGERLGNDFEGNKKMFWKEEKRVRKSEQAREEIVKDVCCQILRDGVEVRRRWAEYFEQGRRRAGIERELASRADQRVLRWCGHVERMDEYRMARRVLMAEVSGGRVPGRPRLGWMDGVKVALGNGGMTVEAARQCAKYRKK